MDSTPSVTDLATSETAASRETTATTPGRKECIACESHAVQQFLDLGETALANKFITEGELAEPEEKYPLRVGFCHTCGHVQLTERVPPDAMFTDYLYMSSASDTLMAHFQELSETMVERHELNANDLVIDIGCNDASLLECFRQLGVKTLGVDPAENLAELFSDNGIDRYTGYFNSRTVREILPRWGKATLVTATNTFPHIPQLHDFVEAIDTILAPGGVFVIETHYLVDLLDQVAFDTVYHEHVSYWALGPMMHLFEQHGLEIVYAERLPLHHGQLRASVKRRGSGKVNPSVGELLAVEQDRGIDRFETYESFARRAHSMKQQLRRTLTGLKTKGKRLAAYGAPAKGSTLLEFLEVGPETLDFIADRSPLKQGRYTPGSHIPIVAPERLLADRPDYVLLLAWNFAEEILEQQAAYREQGGRFIIPIPNGEIV